jgi:L-alanine-DL-glutamate epimerase-like enolase superfamily enzyme
MTAGSKISVHIEEWATHSPFRIAQRTWTEYRVVVVEITDGQFVGRGEGAPLFYLEETAESVFADIEAARSLLSSVSRHDLVRLMSPGAARAAIDCALWDLEARASGVSIWQLTGIEPKLTSTVYTIGLETDLEAVARRAKAASGYDKLKIKLDANEPIERVSVVRSVRPDAELLIDANQSWTLDQLVQLTPDLLELGVQLIEQPLARGKDDALNTYRSPIPLSADESCLSRKDLDDLPDGYEFINVKIDKAGGLTEALSLANDARARDKRIIAGCMGATSLSMAPGFVVAQLSDYVDLDGPTMLKFDRPNGFDYANDGVISLSPLLWGN